MNSSLLKLGYKYFSKSFVTVTKPNKYKVISQPVKLNPLKVPDDMYQEEKYGIETKAPNPGEIYHLPTINSKLIALEHGFIDAFNRAPVSAYYSMKVKDQLYHVFNAARMPLGRMCTQIAHIIQGKNSPHYRPNKVEYKDKCIIVNARHTWMTGKKLEQKLYRHHTGYPGGLKEIKAKHYLEKDCNEMVLRSIKGMLPKNKMRPEFLSKVFIYQEAGHDLYKKGLPQFAYMQPVDYNEVFGINEILKGEAKIISSTLPDKNFPQEFKNIPVEIDEDLDKPSYMKTPKTTIDTRMKNKYDRFTRNWRYRQYRNIRNKAYRYI